MNNCLFGLKFPFSGGKEPGLKALYINFNYFISYRFPLYFNSIIALHHVTPMADTGVYLFVYGTLRKSLVSPMSMLLAQEASFVAEGYLQAALYDLGRYPGAVLSVNPAEQVRGDIYLLPEAQALLERLDEYEECTHRYEQPHEYKRALVDVVTSATVKLSAWTYLYNRPTEALLRIASGDYVQFMAGTAEFTK